MQPAPEEGSAFIPWIGENLDDILCQQEERTVSADNCVSVDGRKLQIPPNKYRKGGVWKTTIAVQNILRKTKKVTKAFNQSLKPIAAPWAAPA